MKKKELTIIIPAYNEENAIGNVIKELKEVCKDIIHEIIVVDDGSTDNTADEVLKYDVKLIKHNVNKGYGASLKTGIKNATSEYIITMDSDGQHRSEDVIKLWENVEDYDMVVGSREKIFHSALWRMPGKWFLNILVSYLLERKIPDLNSGLRIIKRETALKYMHICPSGFSFSTTITMALVSRGYSVKYVPIQVNKRIGKSTVSLATGYKTLILIFRISTLFNPLKIFLPLSFFTGLFGVVYTIIFFITMNRGISVGGILPIMIAFFLFVIGLLCDQISQLRLERFE